MTKKPEFTPLEDKRPLVSGPSQVAAGIPAILSSMKHVFGQSGVVRGTNELLKMNQKRGFDCPGCAWPDPDDKRDMTEFCENGAKAIAEEVTSKRVDPAFFAEHSVASLAAQSDYEIGKSGRITHPVVLREGATHYEAIEWNEAFALIAEELNALSSPNEAIFYTSGRTSNEAAFLYQLFVRLLGSNNLPDCSNMCHESSGVALTESLGIGKGSVKLHDFDLADCILVVGQNPGTNHPRMLTALQKAAANGCKIISINPLFETGMKAFKHPQKFWKWFGRGSAIASLHVPVRVNGDLALIKGILKLMLEAEEKVPGSVLDQAFIRDHSIGFEAFAAELRNTGWDDIHEQSGISRELIQATADIIINSKRIIACFAMGLTQQTHGVACIQQIINLLMLGGNLGRPGAGVCPVRGHSNVQGDRTVGIFEKPSKAFLDSLQKEFGFDPPREHGWDTVEAIKAMHAGEGKVFFAMGGNFLSATPDTEYTADALRRTRLTVHVSTKLNRSHLVHGRRALILPCLGRTDVDEQASGPQFVTVEDSMSSVHMSSGNLKPRSDFQKSEVAIVAELAQATFSSHSGKKGLVDWQKLVNDYDHIRDHIERVIPGFENYNQRVREPGGFYLPHGVRDGRIFLTASGKAQFTCYPLPIIRIPKDRLMLMTVRSHDQFNTTIYGLHDRYRGISSGRRVIFMNEDDIVERNLQDGQWVDITSHFADEKRVAEKFMVVKYDIPKQCAAAYFPETNVLVPIDSVVGRSNTPTYKSVVVTVEASRA